jgi:dihydrofolate reductase
MRKLVVFMHVSLDGFAAGPHGEMDWIGINEEMFDYAERRIQEADTALYGRVTYQMMESYWPTAADQPGATRHDIQHSAWYKKVAKVVLSRTMRGADLPNTRIVSDDVAGQIRGLKQETGRDILIFGSPTASHALMAAGLVDGYWLFVNPVLLGRGKPVFEGLEEKATLSLVENHVFASSGVVCLTYERKRDD